MPAKAGINVFDDIKLSPNTPHRQNGRAHGERSLIRALRILVSCVISDSLKLISSMGDVESK
jgi:hypothetical protein